MTSSIELTSTIQQRMAALGISVEEVEGAPEETIVPQRGVGRPSAAVPSFGGELDLHETLGQGGMGVVWLGTQNSVGRKVAVKGLRPGSAGTELTLQLLREQGHADPLERNLEIFLAVCNAVSFAHSRGVVHRDLKPANVMLGEFGEVYLLDWGVAVSLNEDIQNRLPHASAEGDLVGTPAYMAPEMLEGGPGSIGTHNDVYLLGSILYEVITGRPPHRGKIISELLISVLLREPDPGEGVHPELRQIIRKAKHIKPEERWPSVEALRAAVRGYLDHRGSNRLADVAHARLGELREELSALDKLAEAEVTVGRRPRTLGVVILAIATLGVAVLPLVVDYGDIHPNHYWVSLGINVAAVGLLLVVGFLMRDTLLRGAWLNRRLFGAVLVTFLSHFALEAGDMLTGVPHIVSLHHHHLLWFVIASAIALFTDVRLLLPAFVYLLAFFVSSTMDDMRPTGIAIGIAHFVFLGCVIWFWRPNRGRGDRNAKRRAESWDAL